MIDSGNEGSQAVECMRAYIDAHLTEPLTAKGVADAAGYSQYHAARLFKAATGLSPFEYIRRARLLQSAHSLRTRPTTVLDTALDYVFDSHEGFTRAFANAFGITPKRFARHPPPDGWLIPYRYLNRSKSAREDATMTTETAVIFTQLVERPARTLILHRSRRATNFFEYCEEVGCDSNGVATPWETLCAIRDALYEPVGLWLPDSMRPVGTGTYAHGVELPANFAGDIPDGFDLIGLASCTMLVFQGEPYADEHFAEAVDSCMRQIEKFNPEVYGYDYAPELAPRMQLAPQGWRGYIEMRPVKIRG